MWHTVCLQHLARAGSEQSRSTSVLPINHVIQMPQCLIGICESWLLKDTIKTDNKHTEFPDYMVAVLKTTSWDVGLFPWVKMCVIWFDIQWNDFAYKRMNEITNIEDAMISGIVHSVVHIWYDRLGPFDKQGWRTMATDDRWLVWYAGGLRDIARACSCPWPARSI